jgi:hypothetical protein
VEEAELCQRCSDGSEGSPVNGSEEKEAAIVALSRQQRLRLVLPRTSVWPPRAAAWDKKRHWGVAKR